MKSYLISAGFTLTVCNALFFGLIESAAANAEDDNDKSSRMSVIEEIIVTAQVRKQSSQDVPIAIHAITGNEIIERGITGMEYLNAEVPTLKITAYGNPNFIFIRGVGSGNNLATEQSVGTFVDGVYFGRDRAAKSQLFDLERVEVLKGPQVTLFGKNTIGGALSIVTKKPGDEVEGYVMVNGESEQGSYSGEAAATIPFNEKLRARIGGRYQDHSGWVENTLSGYDDGGAARQVAGRITFTADVSEILTITAKFDETKIDAESDPSEYFLTTPEFLAEMQEIDPRENGKLDNHGSGPGIEPIFNEVWNDIKNENQTLSVDLALGDYVLNSITGYVDYEVDAAGDADQSVLSFLQNRHNQKYSAFSQDIRLLSPQGGLFEFILGAYYSEEELKVRKQVNINLAATRAMDEGLPPIIIPREVTRNQFFSQDTETWSGYGQGTVNLTKMLGLTAGVRYDYVKKEVNDQIMYFSQLGETEPDPINGIIFTTVGLGSVHHFTDVSRSEGNYSSIVRLELKPFERHMYYVGFTQGFKSGGFDEDNARGSTDAGEFKKERVDSYQVGAKMGYNRGLINVDVFYNTLDDLQVASFDGVASFVVTNAAKAISKGVDLEWKQLVGENFTVGLKGTYLKAEYKEYDDAPGVFPEETADLSGEPLPFSPKWSFNASVAYEVEITKSLDLSTQVNLFYSKSYIATFNNDKALEQNNYTKWDLRTAFHHKDGWDVAIVARNITNEIVKTFGNPAPLANFNGLNYFAFTEPARTVALQLSKTF